MKQYMGKSQFNRLLSVFNTQAKTSRDTLQELLDDGFLFAQHPNAGGCGDLSRLTKIIQVCQQVKGLPTRTAQRYIQAHVDCKWIKLSDETYGFKFNGAPDVTIPSKTYYDWEGNNEGKAKPELDLAKRLKAMISQAKRDQKEGKNVGHAEMLPELETMLRKATAQVHKETEQA